MRKTADYLAAISRGGARAMFRVPGWHLDCSKLDSMHVCSLGICQQVNGNVLWEAILSGYCGEGSTQSCLQRCYQDYMEFCSRHQISNRQDVFSVKTFNKKTRQNYPLMLHKAKEGEETLKYTYHIACKINDGSLHANLRQSCVWGLLRYYDVIRVSGRTFTAAQLSELRFAGETMLVSYAALAIESVEHEINAWRIVPKFHLFQHLVETADVNGNPRFVSCYSDEDLVGKLAVFARHSHIATQDLNTMFFYGLFLGIRWNQCFGN